MFSSFKVTWLEHLNSSWLSENLNVIISRQAVIDLYNRLLANKELIVLARPGVIPLGLDDSWDNACSKDDDLNRFVDKLLEDQVAFARAVNADSPFASMLQKRLFVMQRVVFALRCTYYSDSSLPESCTVESIPRAPSSGSHSKTARPASISLLEMGVRTGLSLLFSLMKQSWQCEGSLCNDVLRTALDVVLNLPPLSLSQEGGRMPELGVESLQRCMEFLRSCALPSSNNDSEGRRLSAELILAVAVQRGSLHFILEWVTMALDVSSEIHAMRKQGHTCEACLSKSVFNIVVAQINDVTGIPANMCFLEAILDQEKGETLSLEAAAMFILEECSRLAADYARICDNTDGDRQCSAEDGGADVFAWGSNSSHQLGEGNQDKLLMPRAISAFAGACRLEAGQYCTFVMQRNGVIEACGKGSCKPTRSIAREGRRCKTRLRHGCCKRVRGTVEWHPKHLVRPFECTSLAGECLEPSDSFSLSLQMADWDWGTAATRVKRDSSGSRSRCALWQCLPRG